MEGSIPRHLSPFAAGKLAGDEKEELEQCERDWIFKTAEGPACPALISFVTLTRAREGQAVVPLLRGRSPTRSVAPKPLRGLGRALSPAFLGA